MGHPDLCNTGIPHHTSPHTLPLPYPYPRYRSVVFLAMLGFRFKRRKAMLDEERRRGGAASRIQRCLIHLISSHLISCCYMCVWGRWYRLRVEWYTMPLRQLARISIERKREARERGEEEGRRNRAASRIQVQWRNRYVIPYLYPTYIYTLP